MNGAKVFQVLDLIPDRVARTSTGTLMGDVSATSCVHPERLALITEFLHWLSPIYPTTKDDQMRFGLFAAKQTHVEEDEEVVDLEAEEETVV
jgi:hypothetical protein